MPQRAIIVKVNPDAPDIMFPNERFQDIFPNIVVSEELTETYSSCALRIGFYAVIQKILESYRIPQMLLKYFQKDSCLIPDLVAYMIVDEENAGQYYPDFAFNHPLFSENMRIYSSSKVCRLLKSISMEKINTFLNEWNENRDHKQRIYISYDSSRQAGEREQLEQEIERIKPYLDKHIVEDITVPKSYKKYFNLLFNKRGKLTFYSEKADIIHSKFELCGYFCISTSEQMTAREAIVHYKGRDISENCSVQTSPS